MVGPIRQLTNTHLTHRDQVLNAISEKHYKLNSRIDHSKALALRFSDDLKTAAGTVPPDVSSRLQWIQQQLSQKGV